MATNLPSCFSIEFLEQLLKFLVNFTLLRYVKSQRSYGCLITKELTFGFQIFYLNDHFSASLRTYKLSEQQINPKVLSVANSCHYNENCKIVHRQMSAPRELPQQMPAPGQKLGCKTAPGWGQIPGDAREDGYG